MKGVFTMKDSLRELGIKVIEELMKMGLTDEEIKKILLNTLKLTLLDKDPDFLKEKLLNLEGENLFDNLD